MERLIYAEILKLKNSGILWLATLGTITANMLIAFMAMFLPKVSIDDQSIDVSIEGWIPWVEFHYNSIGNMLLPMFLVIICALSILMENRNNSWKHLYSLPVAKGKIYLSKLLVITGVFFLSHLLFVVIMIIIPFTLGLELNLSDMEWGIVVQLYSHTIVASLGILALVFFVSYFSNSLVFPLAVGIMGFVLAQLLNDYDLNASFFPFSLPSLAHSYSLEDDGSIIPTMLVSVLYFVIISFIGSKMAFLRGIKS